MSSVSRTVRPMCENGIFGDFVGAGKPLRRWRWKFAAVAGRFADSTINGPSDDR
jgi:hypothetical protein